MVGIGEIIEITSAKKVLNHAVSKFGIPLVMPKNIKMLWCGSIKYTEEHSMHHEAITTYHIASDNVQDVDVYLINKTKTLNIELAYEIASKVISSPEDSGEEYIDTCNHILSLTDDPDEDAYSESNYNYILQYLDDELMIYEYMGCYVLTTIDGIDGNTYSSFTVRKER